MTNAILRGKPDAGNPLYKAKMLCTVLAALCAAGVSAADWVYTPRDYEDTKGNVWDTISDGNWRICVTVSGTELSTKGEGTPTSVPPLAVEGTGDVDFSKPVRGSDGTRYTIVGFRQSAFWKFSKANYPDPPRGITSFVLSKEASWVGGVFFASAGDLVSAVLDSARLQYMEYRMFNGCSSIKDLAVNAPGLKYLGWEFAYNLGKVAENASTWRFDSLTNLQTRAFGAMGEMYGAFYFPSAARIAHQCFINDKKIKGLLFGSENPVGDGLVHLGADTAGITVASQLATEQAMIDAARASGGDFNKISVAYAAVLDFLVLGKGKGQVLDDYAFSGINIISNIFFCGDKPTFGATVFRHVNEKVAAIYIPKDNETYAAAIASVTAPTDAEKADFAANHAPGELIGMVNSQTYFGGNGSRKQYLAYGNYRQYLNDIVTTGLPPGITQASNPELYWDCEKTLRDIPTADDYTLTAPANIEIGGIIYGVTGYTVETPSVTGWNAPVAQTGRTYVRSAGTTGTVRITWTWEAVGAPSTMVVAAPADPDWTDDTVTLTLADGSPVPAIIDFGTLLKATPTCPVHADFPKVRFDGWDGLKDGDEVAQDGVVTFAFDGTARKLIARFVHDWVYDASDATVWNRRYRLNVTSLGDAKLGIGTADAMSGTTAAYGNAFILSEADGNPLTELEAGKGLDLRGNVTDAMGVETFVITTIGYRSLGPWAKIADDARVETFYPTSVTTPGTLTTFVGYPFGAADWDYYPMTSLVISEQNLKTVKTGIASGHRDLYRLLLDCPKLKTLPKDVVNSSATCLKETDLGDWNLPLVETVSVQAFGNNCTYPNVTGTLVLPNVKTLGEQALSPLSGAEAFVLGTNGFVLAEIANKAFLKCTKLKRLVLGARGTVTLGTTLLPENSVLTDIDFPGRLPQNLAEVLDALLATKDVSKGAADYVTVTGSCGCGLGARISWTDDFTADEIAHKPEGDVFGIYTTGESVRKAYLVNRPSPWDPKGMMLLVR